MFDNPELHEKDGFQKIILKYLVQTNHYRQGTNASYDMTYAIDKESLFSFLNDTQPDKVEKLRKLLPSFEEPLMKRIREEIHDRTLIDVLKRPLKFNGVSFDLLYRKPNTGMNPNASNLYSKNVFSVTEELVYGTAAEGEEAGRVDLVVFLNGLPVLCFELKSEYSGQDYRDAILQYRNDRSPEERLFKFKEGVFAAFAMDLSNVFFTTRLKGTETFFMPFNRGNKDGAGNPQPSDDIATSYIWKDVLTKDSLMNIIENYLVLETQTKIDRKTGKKKVSETFIWPRWHQRQEVEKIIGDIKQNKTGKNYLIADSAGSGKTFSIAWLAHRLSWLHDEEDKNVFDTVIVITDRLVVDDQLQHAVLSIDHKTGSIAVMDNHCNSSDLADALNGDIKIIVSTIQKFSYILTKINKMRERKFAVIIDECHSSTAGQDMLAVNTALSKDEESDEEDAINSQMALFTKAHGKQANVSMIGYSATPKASTLSIFGTLGPDGKKHPFCQYTMKQAIEEGFIFDVLKNYTTYKTFYEINKKMADDPAINKKLGKKAIMRFVDLHPTNIAQKIEIIVENFRDNIMAKIGGRAKAMVITDSRPSAVLYKKAFDEYIIGKGYNDIRALVAFTGEVKIHNDPIKYTEVSMNGGQISEEALPDVFDGDDYQVLLVADKYQTGYDQPLLEAMYVDKTLNGIKAVQTLSRVNRVCKGKEQPFILDFKNTYEDIVKAFKPYFKTTQLVNDLDPNKIYSLEREIDDSEILDVDDIAAYCAIIRKDDLTESEKTRAYSLVMKAKMRFDSIEEKDSRFKLRSGIKAFLRLYEWIMVASSFSDNDLFEKYVFLKRLVKVIDVGGEPDGIDLSDKIVLLKIQQKKTAEITSSNPQSDPNLVLHAPRSKTPEQEEKERLSVLIQEMNELFHTEFDKGITENTVKQIEDLLTEDNELKVSALHNTKKDFMFALSKKFDETLVKGSDQSQKFYDLLLDNEEAKKKFIDFIATVIYDKLTSAK
jgi:type I restriction enzyme R subunit